MNLDWYDILKPLSNFVILVDVVIRFCFVCFWKLSEFQSSLWKKELKEERQHWGITYGEVITVWDHWDAFSWEKHCIYTRREAEDQISFLLSVALNSPTISYRPKYSQYLIESLFPNHFNFSFLDHCNTFYITTLHNHEQLPPAFCDVYIVSGDWKILEHIPSMYILSPHMLYHASTEVQFLLYIKI